LIKKKIVDALPSNGVASKRCRPNIDIVNAIDLNINKAWSQDQIGCSGLVATKRGNRPDATLCHLNSGGVELTVRQ
jgi:hypothetical protein